MFEYTNSGTQLNNKKNHQRIKHLLLEKRRAFLFVNSVSGFHFPEAIEEKLLHSYCKKANIKIIRNVPMDTIRTII